MPPSKQMYLGVDKKEENLFKTYPWCLGYISFFCKIMQDVCRHGILAARPEKVPSTWLLSFLLPGRYAVYDNIEEAFSV